MTGLAGLEPATEPPAWLRGLPDGALGVRLGVDATLDRGDAFAEWRRPIGSVTGFGRAHLGTSWSGPRALEGGVAIGVSF